ncbi:interleukin-19 [Vombatus ursinus]|uniref:Interleukin family protein n=1 Tax=Vombatus ursinus TaxID=29139 RepID=A0A4X2KWI0_VOMUR|nr:interleukin-19 [Vombatus ursinus]XP_027727201.1 interleukin-19 [Vombatus ursinus]XP_027727202.1 interleukin-19 [Vombatus ursinus]
MKLSGFPLCLLCATLFLWLAHAGSLKRCQISMDMHHIEKSFHRIKNTIQMKDVFQNVTILSASETLYNITPSDVCCMTKDVLGLYVDKVFRNHEESDPRIQRGLSTIANSFLHIRNALEQCKNQRNCDCQKEATEKFQIIVGNYEQMEVKAAAIKALGELDILLSWISRNYRPKATTK